MNLIIELNPKIKALQTPTNLHYISYEMISAEIFITLFPY